MTEKLHGTCSIFAHLEDGFAVSSKGLAGRKLKLIESEANIYWRSARDYGLEELLLACPVGTHVFGETIGVQDLKYGLPNGNLALRVFDIYAPDRDWLSRSELSSICDRYELPTVPVLFDGAYDESLVRELAAGDTTEPEAGHIREGVVVRADPERRDPFLGRVILKVINPDYDTRGGSPTELE